MRSFKGFIASISAVSGLCLVSAFSPSTLQAQINLEDLKTYVEANRPETCAAWKTYGSQTSRASNLQVYNASDNAVQMSWIDFNGKRKKYQVIEPGGYVDQPTYESHNWVVEEVRPPHACKAGIQVGQSSVYVKVVN